MDKDINKYQVTNREADILYTLWRADRPLMASEIANEGLKLTTVHTALKRMLKKELVEVVDFVKSGNVYGRSYRPTMSVTDFEMDKFCNEYNNCKSEDMSLVCLMETLLEGADKETVIEELNNLERIIKEKREELKREEENEENAENAGE